MRATTESARRLSIATGATAGVVAVMDSATQGEWPQMKSFIGAGAMTVMLTAMAGPMPELATGFAALVMISLLLARGGDVVTRIVSYFSGPKPKKPKKPKQPKKSD